MATYAELRSLFKHNELRNKVDVACIVAAETVRSEDSGVPNNANRLIWAKRVFSNPRGVSEEMLMALLAANKDVDTAAIITASDASIQAKVDAAVDVFADGS